MRKTSGDTKEKNKQKVDKFFRRGKILHGAASLALEQKEGKVSEKFITFIQQHNKHANSNKVNIFHAIAAYGSLSAIKHCLKTYPAQCQKKVQWGSSMLDFAAEFSQSLEVVKYFIDELKKFDLNIDLISYACANENNEVKNHIFATDEMKKFLELQPHLVIKRATEGNMIIDDKRKLIFLSYLDNHYLNQQDLEVYAKQQKNLSIVEIYNFLLKYGDVKRLEKFKELYPKHAELELPNKATPLIIASKNGNHTLVEHLLKQNPEYLKKVDEKGDTALGWASYNGHLSVVKGLLKYKANIEAKNSHDETALIWAASNDQLEVVKYLLKQKDNIEEKNTHADNALIWAALNGHVEDVKNLLDEGANR